MNRYFRLLNQSISLCFALFVTAALHADNTFVPELKPNPEYLPDEVVGIQMRALGHNDQPFNDAGIELTFRFASPSNKVNTGPLDRFSRLFSHPAYEPMLNHQILEIGSAEIKDNKARVPVMIGTVAGVRMAYVFSLSKQIEAPYADCWMTDSVTPISLTRSDAPAVM